MTITLLALGAQPPLGTSQQAKIVVCNAVDVSTLVALRLDIDTTPGLDGCDLTVYFDTGPTSTGPWTQIAEVKQSHSIALKKRVVLTGFDNFVRIRFLALRYGFESGSWQLGVYGTGIAGTVS